MTHDEFLNRICIERNALDAEVALLKLRNLALSAQLDAKEHAELIADAEIERAKALDERNAMLSARLEEAQRTVWARDGVLAMTVDRLGGMVEGRPTERVNFLQRIDALRALEASRGEIIKACPMCGCQEITKEDAGGYRCPHNGQFIEPAYYQKVTKS